MVKLVRAWAVDCDDTSHGFAGCTGRLASNEKITRLERPEVSIVAALIQALMITTPAAPAVP